MVDARKPGSRWESVEGDALETQLTARGTLKGLLPEVSGIYMWRLRLRPSVSVHDQVGLIHHVERVSRLPQGRINELKMSRSLILEAMTFGGSGLPETKVAVLRHMARSAVGARILWDFLADLESRVPALYVGESGRLPERIVDHMKGKTEFGAAVAAEEVMSWSDLTLEYLRTGDMSDGESSNRQALEYLATILTIANYTQRAG